MKKIIITMSIVLGIALGGIFNIVSFTDVTKNTVACGDTDKTGGSSAET